MRMNDGYDVGRGLVFEFLNARRPDVNPGPVMCEIAYPHLVMLVQHAYQTGLSEGRANHRQDIVNPFKGNDTDGGGTRFDRLEFPSRAEEEEP